VSGVDHRMQQASRSAPQRSATPQVFNPSALHTIAQTKPARATVPATPLPGRPLYPVATPPTRPICGVATGVAQAKMKIASGVTVEQLADAIRRTGYVNQCPIGALKNAIFHLLTGPEPFGTVDIRNRQQVALLAIRIARRFDRKDMAIPERKHAPFGSASSTDKVYALAIIGAGSAAAYYLDTLGPTPARSEIVVIGGENPWLQQRGHGISFINHTPRQIDMPSKNTTTYGGNESFVERKAFAHAANRVIRSAAGTWIQFDAVTTIIQEPPAPISSSSSLGKPPSSIYRISVATSSKSIRAYKVIYAAGAGAPRTPKELIPPKAGASSSSSAPPELKNKDRIIDMNTFIREHASSKTGTGRVAVWGSNAAIDAVAAARLHGWKIIHWIYGSSKPTWLPGTRYKSAPYNLQNIPGTSYAESERASMAICDDGSKLMVKKGDRILAGKLDYVIYGLGSEDKLTQGKLMDKSVLEGKTLLKPISDPGRAFTSNGFQDGNAFLGWQNESGTFQVIGLAAENYAGEPPSAPVTAAESKEIAATRPQAEAKGARMGPDSTGVKALKNWVSGDVVGVGQLTYARSAIRALNNYVPGSIVSRIDYSHADANLMRIHLAAKYPALTEEYAALFIDMIRKILAASGKRLPHGFTQEQTSYLDRELNRRNRMVKNNIPSAPRQWCDALRYKLQSMIPKKGREVAQGLEKLKRQ